MPRWWKRKREEQDAELALNMMARPGGPALPREYMPGIYGEPSANPQRWTTVDTPGAPPATYYGPTITNQYGQRMRPVPYQKPPKLKEKDMRRYWVKAAPPPPGTRVLLQDAPILGTNPYARVHIDGSLPPPGSIPVEYHGCVLGEQVEEHDWGNGALRREDSDDSCYASQAHARSSAAGSSVPAPASVPADYYGPNYGGQAVPRLERPNISSHAYQGVPYPSAAGQYSSIPGSLPDNIYGPTQGGPFWAHGMGYTAPIHEKSNQSYYASQGHAPPSAAFPSIPVPGSMPIDYYGPTSSGRAEERGMGYAERPDHLYHASPGHAHPTVNGPSPSTPPLTARQSEERPRTSGSSSRTVYLTPRSQSRSPAPGDQDYVSTIDLTFPKSSKRQLAREKAKRERHGYTVPVRGPETIAVPMNPQIVHSWPRRNDRNASEFTSGRSSHLSEVTSHEGWQAEANFEADIDSPKPAAIVHTECIQFPASQRVDIAQEAPSADATDTASLESGLSLDGGVEGVLVEDELRVPEKPRLRDLLGAHPKATLQPIPSHEDRSRKDSLQVEPGTVIVPTVQGEPGSFRPYVQQSTKVSDGGSPFLTPGTLPDSSGPGMRRGGLSYDGRAPLQATPVLAGRILRDDVPLPLAVEALRPRRRPDLVDSGGQSSHVSSSLQGEPTTASSYTSAQSLAHSVAQTTPQIATIVQPWANIIPIPRNSKVEGTNVIRTLNHLHGENRQQPTVRVMALPSAIRTAGARESDHEYTGPIGSANGPPLRVMQIPDEVNVEYYEQIAVRRPATTKRRVIQ